MISTYHLIIVTGCQRSGTTLLGQMLGAHPNAFLIDEPDGLYPWFDSFIENESFSSNQFGELIERANLKYSDRKAKFDQKNGVLKNISHLVLKAPNLAYYFDQIASLKTTSTIVFPVRDVRAVASSMAKLPHIDMVANQIKWLKRNLVMAERHQNDLEKLQDPNRSQHIKRAIVWRIKTGIFNDYQIKKLKPIVFRYEDLVSTPYEYCGTICHQTNLSDSSKMLQHENFYVGIGPGSTRRSRPIDTESLASWADHLSEQEQLEILEEAQSLMTELGYEF